MGTTKYKHEYLRRLAFCVGFVITSPFVVPVGGLIFAGYILGAALDVAARYLNQPREETRTVSRTPEPTLPSPSYHPGEGKCKR